MRAASPLALREPGGALGAASKALAIAGMGARRRFADLGEAALRASFVAVTIYIFAQLWRSVQRGAEPRPGGHTVAELVWYLAFTEAIVFSTPSNWALEVDREVRTGDIAYRLARPLPYPLYHLAASLGERLPRFCACLAIGAASAFVTVGPIPLRPAAVAAALVTAALGVTVDEIVSLAISLSSFWVENTSGLHLLYRRATLLLGGALVPIEAYPAWLARLGRALPFRHLAAGPAGLFVGPDAGGFIALASTQIALGAAALVPLIAIYRFGLRQVSAQGGLDHETRSLYRLPGRGLLARQPARGARVPGFVRQRVRRHADQ